MKIVTFIFIAFLIYSGIAKFRINNPTKIYSKNLKLRYYISYILWMQIVIFVWINMMLGTKPNKIEVVLSILISTIGLVSLLHCINKMAVLAEKYYYSKGELDKSIYWNDRSDRAKLELKVVLALVIFIGLTFVYFMIVKSLY